LTGRSRGRGVDQHVRDDQRWRDDDAGRALEEQPTKRAAFGCEMPLDR
jgi:hypothetical protein